MPYITYIEKSFNAKSQTKIEQAKEIIDEYSRQGFSLTLRQLYYQFVSRDLISNTQRDYKNLGTLINNARLAGLIDWDTIEDRTRNLKSSSHWTSPSQIISACQDQYRIDRWETQSYRPEVWIEKDALTGVIAGICGELDVPYFSCRGYTSQSETWRAGQRMLQHADNGQEPYLIHLGDHDPSGMDMTRDINDRLNLFMGARGPLTVSRIALNMDQVELYGPPPNPAKTTDSRLIGYIEKYGEESWELDALEPRVIVDLIETEILSIRNEDQWDKALEKEQKHIDILNRLAIEADEE